MRRTFTTTIPLLLAVVAAQAALGGNAAATEPPAPEAAPAPFIDSGNTFPDLAAPERHPPAKVTPSVRGAWYGWQILLGDVAATTCVLAFQNGGCVAPYFLTGPSVHIAHGRNGLAAASFGLRLGGPALGAVIGAGLAHCPNRSPPAPSPPRTESDSPTFIPDLGSLDFCGLDYMAVGMLVGAAAAIIVDTSLGFERVEAGTKPKSAPLQLPTIEPTVSVGTSGVAVGLGAAF
jgi:hypothetical protein